MPRFKDQAICIRDLDWSETSQVVVLLTEAHGKIRGLAKGSRRQSPSSLARFSGGIELLTAGQAVVTTRPSSDLAAITEWDLQQDYYPLRRDLRAQRLAMYAADLVHAMLPDEAAHPVAFALMRDLLDRLCQRGTVPPAAVPSEPHHADAALLRFQWGLLEDCGYKPELERDVRTDKPLPDAPAYSFDPAAGGFTAQAGLADWRVRAQTLALLRGIADPPTAADAAARPAGGDPASLDRANKLLCVYARAILDKELPTMAVVLGPSAA
ncbi:MAG: DNA repair protein RecO [Planctomycetota bacterium]